MQIDKETLLGFLRDRGQHGDADRAESELPDRVDTDRDGGLLGRFGLDPQELISKLGGGKLGDMLGKFGR